MAPVTMTCPICPSGYGQVIKYGFFNRICGQKSRIQRFHCKLCRSSFSSQTGTLTYRERKPHLTQKVMRTAMEGMSQRGCARTLGCQPVTVARKECRLGKRARELLLARDPRDIDAGNETVVLFDEMETFEHTKCKPVSIAIAVAKTTRQVIAVLATQMPPKKKLSAIAKRRYGPRRDKRREGMREVLSEVARMCPNIEVLKSDMCPRYPSIVHEIFPKRVKHQTFKGRRACIVGQGELKKGGFDPLFALNHTCAMFRDRIKRLARKTWCTTKKIERLNHLLNLYAWWHNNLVTNTPRPFRLD